jgi:hypothetical protein
MFFLLFYYTVHHLAVDSTISLALYVSLFFFLSTVAFYVVIYFLLWIGNKQLDNRTGPNSD